MPACADTRGHRSWEGLPWQPPSMIALGSGQDQETWVLLLALPLSCHGTMGGTLPLSGPQFPHEAEKGVNLTKSLSSHQPEPWILESNREKGTRRPVESLEGFWISRHMSVGPLCSASSLNIFTAPLIHPSIYPSIHPSLWPCEPQRIEIN